MKRLITFLLAALLALPGLAGPFAISGSSVSVWEVLRNVMDFGAVCDGVTDDKTKFEAARDSVASGTQVRIIVPGGATGSNKSCVLSGAIATNGRIVTWDLQPGASIVGGAAAKFSWPARWREVGTTGVRHDYSSQAIDTNLGSASHEYRQMDRSNDTTQGYGVRWAFHSPAYGANFDIASAIIGTWDRSLTQDGGQNLTQWLVSITPTVVGATTRWGQFVSEWNVVNRGGDTGWTKTRGALNNWSGVMQAVVESNNFSQGGTTYNATYHYGIFPSTANKADGIPGQSYNGILMEPNAIAGTGYGAYWSGNNSGTAGRDPNAGLTLDETWKAGFETNKATLSGTDQLAYTAGSTHAFGWQNSSGTLQAKITQSSGTVTVGKVTLTAPATGSTLTIADGKTLTASNSITLAGTDAKTYTFPTQTSTVAPFLGPNTFANTQACNATYNRFKAFITDLGAFGTEAWCDGTNTRWRPIGGQVVLKQQGPSGNIANSETIVVQALVPTNFLQTGDIVQFWPNLKKSGTTDSCTSNVRVGTAGTTADTAATGFSGASLLAASNLLVGSIVEFRIASTTTMLRQGPPALAWGAQNTNAEPAAATIPDISANADYFSLSIQSSGTTNTCTLQSARIVLVTG